MKKRGRMSVVRFGKRTWIRERGWERPRSERG